MKERDFTITTDNGEEILCEILFTHHSDEFNKNYVIFVKKDTNEASAACYIEGQNGEGTLEPVETEEEWSMLEDLLEDYSKNAHDTQEECSCGGCHGDCHCDGDCDCDHDCDCDDEGHGCNCKHE